MQVIDTQPLRASAVMRLDEPAEVILVVVLVGAGTVSAANAGLSSDAAASCPPLNEMEAALEEGMFVIQNSAVVLKLAFSDETADGLQTCASLFLT